MYSYSCCEIISETISVTVVLPVSRKDCLIVISAINIAVQLLYALW
jgi:hypothetical protein